MVFVTLVYGEDRKNNARHLTDYWTAHKAHDTTTQAHNSLC